MAIDYGFPMVFPCFLMVFPCFLMVFPCFLMVFPCFSMVFPCFFHGFPIFSDGFPMAIECRTKQCINALWRKGTSFASHWVVHPLRLRVSLLEPTPETVTIKSTKCVVHVKQPSFFVCVYVFVYIYIYTFYRHACAYIFI